jgi:uncharacterized membrane protein YphA (DoxX/SURF4 family)
MSDATTPGAAAGEARPAKSFTRFIPVIARLLLGLLFTVTGLNGFFEFIPQPKDPQPEAAVAFATALMKTGYMMKLVTGTQLVGGVMLLTGLFVPLGLTLLAPVVVNIAAFHFFLAPSGNVTAGVVLLLELYLAFAYRSAFRSMLAIRVAPA